MHHVELASQNDRIALNKAHAHLKELQAGYSQSEASRARFENDLHEERQEHRMCQEALNHERIRHSETEKNLNCVWNAHTRLGEIIFKAPYQMTASGEEKTGDSIDITELVLELEAKAFKIQGLEDALIHQQEQSHSDLLLIEGRLHERSVQH